jgi:hypothetical protein
MTGPLIIALAGPGRVGKNTIGEYLGRQHGFYDLAFAEPLYRGIEEALFLTPEEMADENKDAPLERFCGTFQDGFHGTFKALTLRDLLEEFGDLLRRRCGDDVLMRVVAREIDDWFCGRNGGGTLTDFVITDLRLPEEADWVRAQGGTVWHVGKSDAPQSSTHRTAQPLISTYGERVDDILAEMNVREFGKSALTLVTAP